MNGRNLCIHNVVKSRIDINSPRNTSYPIMHGKSWKVFIIRIHKRDIQAIYRA